MTLLIDAYNVLHCSHLLPERYALVSAPQLCQLLDRTRFYRGRIVVVCDGRPKPSEDPQLDIGDVELVYSGPNTDADSIIEKRIEADDAPRELVVVSNDRRLQRAARRRRGTFVGSEHFLRQLTGAIHRAGRGPDAPEKPTAGTDENDAEMWMHKFGLTETPPPQRDVESGIDRWMREFGFDPDEDEGAG